MRQVIRRFLNHLETEKNASLTTIESYWYDLNKFDDYLVKRLGNRFLPGDVTWDHKSRQADRPDDSTHRAGAGG